MGAPAPGVRGGADELAAGGERGGRSLSPWIWRGMGLAVVALVAALSGPSPLSGSFGRPPPEATPTPATDAHATRFPAPVRAPLRWAARGDLLRSGFAVTALARFRADRPDVDRLVWAGSVVGGDRVAVVAYEPAPGGSAGIELAALLSRTGEDPANAGVTNIGTVRWPRGTVAFAWRSRDHTGRLLLLADPSPLAVQVSPFVDYHRDGTVSRRWRDVGSQDGAVVVDLGSRVDPSIVVRPADVSSGVASLLVGVQGTAAHEPAGFDIAGSRGARYAGPEPLMLTDGVTQALRPLLDMRDADARVVWDGTISAGRDEKPGAGTYGRAALVRVRRHDGPVFQVFVFVDQTGALRAADANPVRWHDGDRLPYAFSTFDGGAPLYLLNPSGAGSVTVQPDDGSARDVALDANGVGVLLLDAGHGPAYTGARIVVRDRDGGTVLRSRLVDPGIVDPFGLYL